MCFNNGLPHIDAAPTETELPQLLVALCVVEKSIPQHKVPGPVAVHDVGVFVQNALHHRTQSQRVNLQDVQIHGTLVTQFAGKKNILQKRLRIEWTK